LLGWNSGVPSKPGFGFAGVEFRRFWQFWQSFFGSVSSVLIRGKKTYDFEKPFFAKTFVDGSVFFGSVSSVLISGKNMTSAQKASRLLELHHGDQPLVLINCWDAASAAMVEHCGLPAVATSSAALANALGFPDGQYLPWEQMLEAVARVCRAVKVPVTADIESGFAADVTALETSITQIIQTGAVGVNLEDVMPDLQSANLQNAGLQDAGLQDGDLQDGDLQDGDLQDGDLGDADPKNSDLKNSDPKSAGSKNAGPKKAKANVRHGNPLFPLPEQIARIQAARRAADAQGVHLVINARTDAYWQSGVEPAEAMRGTLERGKAYLQAGADCIFIPGLRNPEHIKTVIDHLSAPDPRTPDRRTNDLRADDLRNVHGVAPVNILAGPGVPSIPELAKLGVKRVSYGSGPHRAAMGLLRRMAQEARTSGTYTALTEGAVPYEEMNGLMGK
jgi:2-methylisocitrate lyase-like PEP mutase family enzyme